MDNLADCGIGQALFGEFHAGFAGCGSEMPTTVLVLRRARTAAVLP